MSCLSPRTRIAKAWAYLRVLLWVCTTAALVGGAIPADSEAEEKSNGGGAENAAARSAESDGAGKYIGPGSCAATSCHGSVKPVAGSRILQDEYSTWILKDK